MRRQVFVRQCIHHPFHCFLWWVQCCKQPQIGARPGHQQIVPIYGRRQTIYDCVALPQPTPQLHRDVLGRILAVARHLSASSDLNEILKVIIDAMRDTLQADRATVFEYDPKTNELFTTVAHGVAIAGDGSDSPREIRIPATKGLAGECAQTQQIINVPDAYADNRFNQAVDKQTGYRTHSILTIPLLGHDGELVGVAQVLNKRGGAFNSEDEEIAGALAAQAAVAMKRGRLIEDRMVREKLERDLELARKIQQSSFPKELPRINGFDLAAWSEPADETGGDVYDVVARDREVARPSGSTTSDTSRLVLLMADATGHGVGPALSVTQLRSMLRMAVRLNADLSDMARHANQQLCDDLPGGRFITAWFGELDSVMGTIATLSAGQAPLIHYIASQDRFDVFEADTLPLGVVDLPETTPPRVIPMHDGDLFAVISDGIFESRNPEGQQFGADHVNECLRQSRQRTAEDMLNAMRTALEVFTRGEPAEDDRTAIIIKRCTR